LKAHYLKLDTLGIENGCIDAVSQALSWPEFAYNNTYGFQMINETVYKELVQQVTDPEAGCLAAIHNCRQIANVGDPQFYANNKTVNDVCALAMQQCWPLLTISLAYADRDAFDIAQIDSQRFPGYQHISFFNQRWVQQGLGVPLNYTDNANLTNLYFLEDGDAFRQNQSSIEYLLEKDVQVALVYGDRDSRCNWIGVENVSLTVEYPDAPKFRDAGYADLRTNETYSGGVVRQYDGFSFSRVFDAGHAVSAFQPQTAYEIFNRVMFRRDVATGLVPAGSEQQRTSGSKRRSSRISRFKHSARGADTKSHYQSQGPSSSWHIKNNLPASPPRVCNLWLAPPTCTENQIEALANGTASTQDFIVKSPAE
jgi:carboxypeptidase C (cathepsin A)